MGHEAWTQLGSSLPQMAGAGIIAFLVIVFKSPFLLHWSFRRRARRQIRQHLKTLAIKRQRGYRKDDYGNWVDDGWAKEAAYFYRAVVVPRLKLNSRAQAYYQHRFFKL